MSSIMSLWKNNKELFETKNVHQLISFMGDGRLKDESQTSLEFREILNIVPSKFLILWANQCLDETFEGSGLVLQDIVNQVGIRLGFNVEYGLYKGRKNKIGYDGIWSSIDNHNIVIEVKTTDTYRINLDTLYDYRRQLINNNCIELERSSILIIVGRQDTGDLEAQIRGSRHAWDIRLISTESLLNLLMLKEKLNDARTSLQINSILKPMEYTKLDKLINLIFTTANDMELDDEVEESIISTDIEMPNNQVNMKNNNDQDNTQNKRNKPVNFHQECISIMESKYNISLQKQSRTSYLSSDKKFAVTLAISKEHNGGAHDAKYWFAFHPHQREFLNNYKQGVVTFGCGTSENLFAIDFIEFNNLLEYMWTTENEKRMYWHIVIYQDGQDFNLQLPNQNKYKDLQNYRVK